MKPFELDWPSAPTWELGSVVIPPPDGASGWWSGAPSARYEDGIWYLAYRLRRPVGGGRGYANVVARSSDGLAFETSAVLDKADFGTESLERPALVRTPNGRWRLYVSCATTGTKHWRVDMVEAATPEGLATVTPRTILPGDEETAVKDPVVLHANGRWHLWASCHPLDDPHATDRVRTDYATSEDGVTWTWHGTVLAAQPGRWDARGVRITSVLPAGGRRAVAFYDGRASAAENWEERTGLALGSIGPTRYNRFRAVGSGPAAWSPHRAGGLRYVSAVLLPNGEVRLYYEATRADGAHELRTELVPARKSRSSGVSRPSRTDAGP